MNIEKQSTLGLNRSGDLNLNPSLTPNDLLPHEPRAANVGNVHIGFTDGS